MISLLLAFAMPVDDYRASGSLTGSPTGSPVITFEMTGPPPRAEVVIQRIEVDQLQVAFECRVSSKRMVLHNCKIDTRSYEGDYPKGGSLKYLVEGGTITPDQKFDGSMEANGAVVVFREGKPRPKIDQCIPPICFGH